LITDDEALAGGFAHWLGHRQGGDPPVVTGVHRPSSGYASRTVIVDVEEPAAGAGRSRSYVVRTAPAAAGTFPHYDLVTQGQAQAAAAGAGVPVADPVVETDTRWTGAPFMVMPRIDGHIIGSLAHRDRWLGALDASARAQVYRRFVTTLALIHRADLSAAPRVPRRGGRAELDYWERYLSWSSGGHPVPTLADALAWCRRHRPESDPDPVLLWGDARFENVVFGDNLHPLAVLDWDMTTVGAPEHDLAWFTSLDNTAAALFGERLAGFPDRAATVALFEETSGRRVHHLGWYETLAMVKSTAVMTRISYLRRDAGEPPFLPIDDNPLLDLLRARL
jgi:aminoglycoside phosphotransferase (APT) family kinase protein